MRKLLAGLVLAIGVAVLAAASASAANSPNVTCHSGDILEGTYHNVTVAKGNFSDPRFGRPETCLFKGFQSSEIG
jgi:hypothetical protein